MRLRSSGAKLQMGNCVAAGVAVIVAVDSSKVLELANAGIYRAVSHVDDPCMSSCHSPCTELLILQQSVCIEVHRVNRKGMERFTVLRKH